MRTATTRYVVALLAALVAFGVVTFFVWPDPYGAAFALLAAVTVGGPLAVWADSGS